MTLIVVILHQNVKTYIYTTTHYQVSDMWY